MSSELIRQLTDLTPAQLDQLSRCELTRNAGQLDQPTYLTLDVVRAIPNKSFNRAKTDPVKCDTDRGDVSDGREVRFGSDPTRIKSGPDDLERPVRGPGKTYPGSG